MDIKEIPTLKIKNNLNLKIIKISNTVRTILEEQVHGIDVNL